MKADTFQLPFSWIAVNKVTLQGDQFGRLTRSPSDVNTGVNIGEYVNKGEQENIYGR